MSWRGADQIDAEPGAQWGTVAAMALERGLTPPVLPDALMLTVGGTLSAGGTGATSCSAGAQVDHVSELDVVTGRGELVTCSPSRNRELFAMTLAALGQCGIIVRARLRLAPAAAYVVTRTLTYSDSDVLIADLIRLAVSEPVPFLGGEIMKDATGTWRLALLAGAYAEQPLDEPSKPAWMAGLKFDADARASAPLWDHLDRRTASVAATKAMGSPNPSLALVLPETAVGPFLASVLSDPDTSAGVWRIELLPMIANRFKQPLHVLPQGKIAFTVRLQRRASGENAPDHVKMLTANQRLVERCLKDRGKIYPPFAPPMSRENWQLHYGPRLWQRLAAAKKRFDPNNVLTPGAGVFA
jgi:FAD/FMN-containing dehydrogenase